MMSFELTIKNETEGYDRKEVTAKVDDSVTTAKSDVVKEKKGGGSDAVMGPAEKKDAYVLGVTGSYKMGDLFGISLALGTTETATLKNADKKTGIAVEVTSKPIEGISVKVPFDFLTKKDGTAMELRPDVQATFGAFNAGLNFHYISVGKKLNALAKDYTNMTLGSNFGYTLDAGKATLDVATNLGDKEGEDLSLELKLGWTAATYNVTVDVKNVLAKDYMETTGFGIKAGYTGIAGLDVAVETEVKDGGFKLAKLNIDLKSELTTV
jgi:hypothetical protein